MKIVSPLIIVVLVLASVFTGSSQERTTNFLNDQQISTLIDSLSESLKTYYTYPDKATEMAEFLNAQLKGDVYKKYRNPTELAYKLGSDIRHIYADAHMHIVFEPGLRPPIELSLVEQKRAYQEQLAAERENNFNLKKVEILPGNIGYFRFDGFTHFIEEAKPTVFAGLSFLSNTKALILDLRFNGGGSTINQFSSYFFQQKTHLYDQVSTISKDTLVFNTDPSSTDSLALLMPIYILTSKNTASAAEAFASSMQALSRAVVIGDTTLGASHFTGFFPLGQGFIAKIPFARPVNTATFKDWERTGVIPNFAAPAPIALHKAQEFVLEELLSRAETKKQKGIIMWAINSLKAKKILVNPPTSILSNYVGKFSGGIRFYVEKGELLCKNPERGGTDTFKLKAVTEDIFLLDENAQVQFIKDASGYYSSLNLLWKDGSVTKKIRE